MRRMFTIGVVIVLSGCWAQFRGDAGHAGSQAFESAIGTSNVGALAITWHGRTGSGTVNATPTIANGVAYVGSSDHKLYAFDAAGDCVALKTCAVRWTGLTGNIIKGGSPAVANNVVYVGSDDRKLYAFSADGSTGCSGTPKTCTPLWTAATGAAVESSPTVTGGVVYVESANLKLEAFDAAGVTNCTTVTATTCTPLWTATIGPSGGLSPAVANGVAYVATTDGVLAAFDATGTINCTGTTKTCKPLWTAALGGASNPAGGPAVANGTVFIAGATQDLLAFDGAGTTNCSGTPKTCTPIWTGAAPRSSREVAVANGRVYEAAADGTISVFDATGHENCTGTPARCTPLWSASTNPDAGSPTIANGLLYVSAFADYLYAFDANGVQGCTGTPKTCAALWVTDDGTAPTGVAVAGGAVYADAVGTTGVVAYQPCINPVSFAGWAPCDIRNAYRLPSNRSGRGITVAIVDANHDPNAEADMATYRNMFALPGCSKSSGCFRQVNELGQTSNYPPADVGWSVEISLDLQMVSAACPYCNILLVEGNNTLGDLATAEDTAVALGAKVVSNSYSANEAAGMSAIDSHYLHAGVPIVVASGDNGFAAGPQYPAVIPGVTAVGGTTLARTAGGRGWTESVWHEGFNTAITGSGCSQFEPKPAWQLDTACANRTDNDVAAVASHLAVYDSYGAPGWITVGGTSAAAPLIAGMYALAQGTTGVADLYANSGRFFDITAGNTGACDPAALCTAGVGYDAPTGVGTPCGVGAFGPALTSPAGCAWPGTAPAALVPGAFSFLAPSPVEPACREAPPGGVRCLSYRNA
ncbi:MAG: PQQ-binding-like beta-propeller repeat protein [Acidimicrobiia bacterium]